MTVCDSQARLVFSVAIARSNDQRDKGRQGLWWRGTLPQSSTEDVTKFSDIRSIDFRGHR
jgi:hypothetical protein